MKAYSTEKPRASAENELEVLETYVTMHSPTKGEHKKMKQVVEDVREKISFGNLSSLLLRLDSLFRGQKESWNQVRRRQDIRRRRRRYLLP